MRGEHAGLVIGAREPAMGLRGLPETDILFKDLELPEARALALARTASAKASATS